LLWLGEFLTVLFWDVDYEFYCYMRPPVAGLGIKSELVCCGVGSISCNKFIPWLLP